MIASGIPGRVRWEEHGFLSNSSCADRRTTSRVRSCSVTGSAGLRFHVVNRWPGPPSLRREPLSQDSKAARGGWGSYAGPLESACLVIKTRGQKRHEQEADRTEVRDGETTSRWGFCAKGNLTQVKSDLTANSEVQKCR